MNNPPKKPSKIVDSNVPVDIYHRGRMLIRKFLETHSLAELEKQHGVFASFSKKNPKKFSLNYDQIEPAARDSKIAEEARGLILATSEPITSKDQIVGHARVFAYPFKRFYNAGDPHAAEINFEKATVYFKLDGTCIILYFDPDLSEWCVATRSVPDADVPYNEDGKTFRMLFDETPAPFNYNKEVPENWLKNKDFCKANLNESFTYVLELCTPENEQVVKQKKKSLMLIGVRDLVSMEEQKIENFIFWNRCWSKLFTKIGVDEVLKCANEYIPSSNEGFVICDDKFNRIKIKSSAYCTAHRLKDKSSNSRRNLLELILLEKDDDVRTLLDEKLTEKMDMLFMDLHNMLNMLDSEFKSCITDDRKEFALLVQKGTGLLGPQMWCWQQRHLEYPHKAWLKSLQNEKGEIPDAKLDSVLEMMKKCSDIASLQRSQRLNT